MKKSREVKKPRQTLHMKVEKHKKGKRRIALIKI